MVCLCVYFLKNILMFYTKVQLPLNYTKYLCLILCNFTFNVEVCFTFYCHICRHLNIHNICNVQKMTGC